MSDTIDRIENTVEDMSSVVAPERARWTLPAGRNAVYIAHDGHLLVVHAETVARWLETTKSALDAVRERDARIAKHEAAAHAVVDMQWDHGENCPHRDCDTGEDCGDGDVSEDDGCEATGQACDCHVACINALSALLSPVVRS